MSQEGENLLLEARFNKLTYGGTDQNFHYLLEAKLGKGVKQEDKIKLGQLQLNSSSGNQPVSPETPETPEPQALFTIGELKALQPGEGVDVLLKIQNTGSVTMKSPLARVSASSGLLIPSGNSSRMLGDIPPGESRDFLLGIKAPDKIKSNKESLELRLSFSYDSGKGLRQAEQSDRVEIPISIPKTNTNAPNLLLSHKPVTKSLSPGEAFPLEVRIRNIGKAEATALSLRSTLGPGLFLDDDEPVKSVEKIAPGEEKNLRLGLKTWEEPGEKPLSLDLELGYSYQKDGKTEKDQIVEKVIFPLEGKVAETQNAEEPSFDGGGGGFSSGISTPALDSAVPNMIIKKFSYGGKPVAAGEVFELTMDYGNTSKKLGVENIVIMVEPGENFSIEGASNTYYVESMGAEGNGKQSLKLRALPSAKTGANSIEVTFKYEYVDAEKRSQASLTQKLSVPIYQPDRFQISNPEIPTEVRVGEETTLTLAYVNKGKSEISNVEAHLEGDVETITKDQNLGNFEPGKSGNISFILTPKAEGELKLKLKVSYEDANQEVKTKEFPVTLKVETGMEEMPMEEDAPVEEEKSSLLKPLLLGGLSLGAVVAGVLYYFKRKRNQQEDWDLDDDL